MTISNTYIRSNVALAWPLALNALLIQSMLMIDTLLVAPLGELPLAAMGIATSIVAFALGIEFAIANGVQLLVGRAWGSKSQTDLSLAFWVGLFISVATAMLFWCTLILFGTELVASVTADAEIARLVEAYLSITKYIILITAYAQVCTAFCNGRGRTTLPLKGYLIELPVNAIASYVLINGIGEYTGLGVAGAAWGSLIALFLRSVFLFVAMYADKDVDLTYPQQRPFLAEMRIQFAEIYPIAANYFILSVGATVYQLLFAQLALYSYVAITLIFPWLRSGTQFTTAWAQASAISISQAVGQQDTRNIRIFISSCTRVAVTLSLVIAASFYALSQSIDLIYPKIEYETQMALATIAPLYIILPIVRGYNSVSGNVLRAIGESSRVLKIHFITQWMIALPVCALMILYFDVCLFWAFAIMPMEELLKTIPFFRYTRMSIRRLERSSG